MRRPGVASALGKMPMVNDVTFDTIIDELYVLGEVSMSIVVRKGKRLRPAVERLASQVMYEERAKAASATTSR